MPVPGALTRRRQGCPGRRWGSALAGQVASHQDMQHKVPCLSSPAWFTMKGTRDSHAPGHCILCVMEGQNESVALCGDLKPQDQVMALMCNDGRVPGIWGAV